MIHVVIAAFGVVIGVVLVLLSVVSSESAPTVRNTEYISTMPRENEHPMDGERISAEYNPTLLGSEFDKHIDAVAAGYIIEDDNAAALRHLRDRLRRRLPEATEHLSDEELAGRVEWWVRNNYQHLSAP